MSVNLPTISHAATRIVERNYSRKRLEELVESAISARNEPGGSTDIGESRNEDMSTSLITSAV